MSTVASRSNRSTRHRVDHHHRHRHAHSRHSRKSIDANVKRHGGLNHHHHHAAALGPIPVPLSRNQVRAQIKLKTGGSRRGSCGSMGYRQCLCGCGTWEDCRCPSHSGCCNCRQLLKLYGRSGGALKSESEIETIVPESVVGSAEEQMVQLWDDHVFLTREVIIGLVTALPSVGVSLKKLMRNQDEIASLFKPLYGSRRAQQLANLLHEHIKIAGEIVASLKACKTQAQASGVATDTDLSWQSCDTAVQHLAAWDRNGDEIAQFFYDLNPGLFDQLLGMHVTVDTLIQLRKDYKMLLQQHMKHHLKLTALEAVSYLGSDYDKSIQTAQEALLQARQMAFLFAKIAVGYQSKLANS